MAGGALAFLRPADEASDAEAVDTMPTTPVSEPVDTPPRRRLRQQRDRNRQQPANEVPAAPTVVESPPETGPPETVVPAGARSPNEPAGFTRISERGFAQAREDGWRHREGRNFEILQDPDTPGSDHSFARAHYPGGMRGGSGPVMETRELGGVYRAVYVSMWVRFSENWFGHPSGSNKIFHFWIAGQNKVVVKAQGNGNRPMGVKINLQGVNERPVARTLSANAGGSDGRVIRGRWQRIEVLVRANIPGQSNGSVEWWVDGSKVGSYANVNYVKMAQENLWTTVSWNPTWGGVGSVLPSPQSMDMDHVYVSGQ